MLCAIMFFLHRKDLNMVKKPDGNYILIFRAWRIDPTTGNKIYARDYGKKAWPIWIKVA